jgi:hypothetical protein
VSHASGRARITQARLLLGLLVAAAAGTLLIGASAVTPAGTLRPAPLTLAAAVRVLQSGDVATARHMLETLTRQPDVDARTWRTLGSAYQQQHEQRLAIGAYEEALRMARLTAGLLRPRFRLRRGTRPGASTAVAGTRARDAPLRYDADRRRP